MAMTPLPAAPQRTDPKNFTTKSDAFVAALQTFVTEANALETNVNAKEASAELSAQYASAAANFQGAWADLTGAAAVPYSVSHAGKYWMLASDLADVTAKTPGTGAEWIEMPGAVSGADRIGALNSVIGQYDPARVSMEMVDEFYNSGLIAPQEYKLINGTFIANRSFFTTICGVGSALNYAAPFDSVSIYVQVEDASVNVIARIKKSDMTDVATCRRVVTKSGWNTFFFNTTITDTLLGGTVFYVTFEDEDHTNRMMTPEITAIASANASQTTYPSKYTTTGAGVNVWSNVTTSTWYVLVKAWLSAEAKATAVEYLVDNPPFPNYSAASTVVAYRSLSSYVRSWPFAGWGNLINRSTLSFNALRIVKTVRSMGAYGDAYKWRTIHVEVRDTTTTGTLLASGKITVDYGSDILENILIALVDSNGDSITLDQNNLPAVYFIGFYARSSSQYAIAGDTVGTPTPDNFEGHSYYMNGNSGAWFNYTGGYKVALEQVLLTNPVINETEYHLNATAVRSALSNIIDATPTINLPPKIRVISGREMSVYFDNLINGSYLDYHWDVICNTGKQQNERWVFNTGDSATHPFTLNLHYKQTGQLARTMASSVIINQDTIASGKNPTCLFIGDSTTAAGVYTGELLTLVGADVMDATLIGTQGGGANLHEGYSGKTVAFFYSDPTSPFVFSGVFDFAAYMTAHSYAGVDYVFIHLGINDLFGKTVDSEVDSTIVTMLAQLAEIITSIMAYDATIKVCLMLTIPPAYNQDAFGDVYLNGQTRWRYKRNNHLWVKNLISTYGSSEASGIYLVPTNINLDTEYGFNADTVARSSRTATTVARQNNGVHPGNSGYYQMADAVFSFLKHMEK